MLIKLSKSNFIISNKSSKKIMLEYKKKQTKELNVDHLWHYFEALYKILMKIMRWQLKARKVRKLQFNLNVVDKCQHDLSM